MWYIRPDMDRERSIDAKYSVPLETNLQSLEPIEIDVLPESFGARFNAPINVLNAFKTEIISAVRGLETNSDHQRDERTNHRGEAIIHSKTNAVPRTSRSGEERERENITR